MKWPHLNRAPIREALIDIQVARPNELDLSVLDGVHGRIKEDYPLKRKRHHWQGHFELKPDSAPRQSVDDEVVGYIYSSEDKRNVAQARLDGCTQSRLTPYDDWRELRDKARKLWDAYREVVQPQRVTRVAVRYINELRLKPPIDPADWFTIRLQLPPSLTRGGLQMFTKLTAQHPDQHATSHVIQYAEPQADEDGRIRIVFDIDVFRTREMSPDSEELWTVLDQLRSIKNDIFFEGLTTRAIMAFDPQYSETQ